MLSISYSFSPTTTIESAQVNQDFTDIVNYINNTACVTNMVVGWKGAIGSIPTGWVLDSDLKDKFILGAGNLYAIGATGGATTKNLAHTHTGPSHTHTGPSHTHSYSGTTSNENNTAGVDGYSTSGSEVADHYHQHTFGGDTSAAGTGNTGAAGTGNTGSGGSATQDIMPPYYALAWITKS